uniref:Uncharacterized protein n=1 Tax=Plectus sambesii TaxID=2011161 RepID=A0A914WJT8_9BILA
MSGQITVLFLVFFVAQSWAQFQSCPMGYCIIQGQCYMVIGIGSQCSSTQQCVCNSMQQGIVAGPGTACDAADARCPGAESCFYNGQCFKVLQNGATCSTVESCMCLGPQSNTGMVTSSPSSTMQMDMVCDPVDPLCPGDTTCAMNGQCYNMISNGALCSSNQQCMCTSVGPTGPATGCDVDDPACPGTDSCLYNGQCYKFLPLGQVCQSAEQCACLALPGFGDLFLCDNTNPSCPGVLNCQSNINGQCYNILGSGSICSNTQQCLCTNVGQAGPARSCDRNDPACPGSMSCRYNGQCYNVLAFGDLCSSGDQCVCIGDSVRDGQNTPPQSTPPLVGPMTCDPTNPQCPGGETDCLMNGQCFNIVGVGSICSRSQQCLCSSVGANGPATNCDALNPTCPGSDTCLYNDQCYNVLQFGSTCSSADQCVCFGSSTSPASCDNTDQQCPGALNCTLNGECLQVLGVGSLCSTTQNCICSAVGPSGPAASCDITSGQCPGSDSCLYNGQCYNVLQFGGRCETVEQCVCFGGPTPSGSTNVVVGQVMRKLWQRIKCTVLNMDC